MKMKKDHYNVIRDAIAKLPREAVNAHYNALLIEARAKDINKRFRWDCLRAARLEISDSKSMPGLPLYAYLNDSHIDTALRAIMSELSLPGEIKHESPDN